LSEPLKLGVLVSGGGSNLGAILEAERAGQLSHGKVVIVISSRAGIGALDRAKSFGVPTQVIERKTFPTEEAFQKSLRGALASARVQVLCLAGYLRRLGPEIIQDFRGRILNIHPALLPKYGGAGMYGHYVHEAVVAAGEKESGCSVHVVDEEFDHGPVLAQARVPVLPGDTGNTLGARVLVEEHRLYPKIIEQFCAQGGKG
jgi:phosphoribosylglycinamide formyltransferase-1